MESMNLVEHSAISVPINTDMTILVWKTKNVEDVSKARKRRTESTAQWKC